MTVADHAGSCHETPYSATSPSRAKAVVNRALRPAMRTSHQRASAKPSPAVAPLTAATTGTRTTWASDGPVPCPPIERAPSRDRSWRRLEMSAPAQNPRPGAGDDDRTDVGIGVGGAEPLVVEPRHVAAPRVHLLGLVQGEQRHPVPPLLEHRVGHPSPSSPSGRPGRTAPTLRRAAVRLPTDQSTGTAPPARCPPHGPADLWWNRRVFVPRVEPVTDVDGPSVLICVRGGDVLVRPTEAGAALLEVADPEALPLPAVARQFLGLLDGRPCWSVDVAASTAPPTTPSSCRCGSSTASSTTSSGPSPAGPCRSWSGSAPTSSAAGAARPTQSMPTERARRCPACGLMAFPRLTPAVIMAVHRDDKILLAANATFRGSMYSVLAGFVEPGEPLEEAVRREVEEEVGLAVEPTSPTSAASPGRSRVRS